MLLEIYKNSNLESIISIIIHTIYQTIIFWFMHRKTLKTGASDDTSLTSPQSFGLLLPIIGMHSSE